MAMRGAMLAGLTSQQACDVLGLQHKLKYFYNNLSSKGSDRRGTTFMVDNLRVARRVRDDGELDVQVVAVVRQQRPEPLADKGGAGERFWFRGGATLIIDLLGAGGPKLRYVIRKPTTSASRLARERAYRRGDTGDALRSMYFGASESNRGFADREPFAIMHAARE
jgi:hypothetical protein